MLYRWAMEAFQPFQMLPKLLDVFHDRVLGYKLKCIEALNIGLVIGWALRQCRITEIDIIWLLRKDFFEKVVDGQKRAGTAFDLLQQEFGHGRIYVLGMRRSIDLDSGLNGLRHDVRGILNLWTCWLNVSRRRATSDPDKEWTQFRAILQRGTQKVPPLLKVIHENGVVFKNDGILFGFGNFAPRHNMTCKASNFCTLHEMTRSCLHQRKNGIAVFFDSVDASTQRCAVHCFKHFDIGSVTVRLAQPEFLQTITAPFQIDHKDQGRAFESRRRFLDECSIRRARFRLDFPIRCCRNGNEP